MLRFSSSREVMVDVSVSGFHFSSKRNGKLSQYISEDFTYFSTAYFFTTFEGLQIVENARARAGSSNLEGTAFYQGLQFLSFIYIFEVFQELYDVQLLQTNIFELKKKLLKIEFQNLMETFNFLSHYH